MLPLAPTSCGRNWTAAVALAEVGVMFDVTVIGNTGGGATSSLIEPEKGGQAFAAREQASKVVPWLVIV